MDKTTIKIRTANDWGPKTKKPEHLSEVFNISDGYSGHLLRILIIQESFGKFLSREISFHQSDEIGIPFE